MSSFSFFGLKNFGGKSSIFSLPGFLERWESLATLCTLFYVVELRIEAAFKQCALLLPTLSHSHISPALYLQLFRDN